MWYAYTEKGNKWWAGMESEEEDFTTRGHATEREAIDRLEEVCRKLGIEVEWKT